MELEKFKSIVTHVVSSNQKMEAYLDSMPSDIRDSFFDNEYNNTQGILNDYLLDIILGESLREWVSAVLYENLIGDKVLLNGVEFPISSLSDFFDLMVILGHVSEK